MNLTEGKQNKVTKYYDKFSRIYDWISSKSYYHKPRAVAIKELELNQNQTVLNLPCGTGQNFDYLQKYLKNSGQIIGIDLSEGMLQRAEEKIDKNNWTNVLIIKEDARKINREWRNKALEEQLEVDAVLCDLGLSGFPDWEMIIDNLISILKPTGRIVVMDWHINRPTLRAKFINWIGKGEVNRPIWQYLKTRVENFKVDESFKGGDVFVASGNTRK